jgi:hypothetical protein
VWIERYGRKVDALPILNVDDDLLAWGARVGETFRTMARAERASGIKSGVRKSSVYGNYQYAAATASSLWQSAGPTISCSTSSWMAPSFLYSILLFSICDAIELLGSQGRRRV